MARKPLPTGLKDIFGVFNIDEQDTLLIGAEGPLKNTSDQVVWDGQTFRFGDSLLSVALINDLRLEIIGSVNEIWDKEETGKRWDGEKWVVCHPADQNY